MFDFIKNIFGKRESPKIETPEKNNAPELLEEKELPMCGLCEQEIKSYEERVSQYGKKWHKKCWRKLKKEVRKNGVNSFK